MNHDSSHTAKGTVTSYNQGQGFGFLYVTSHKRQWNHDEEIFFHISDISQSRSGNGQRFKFDIKQTEEGYQAKNLVRIKSRGQSSTTKHKHKPEVTAGTKSDEHVKNRGRGRSNSGSKSNDEKEDDGNDNSVNPFTDSTRGSKNDLL